MWKGSRRAGTGTTITLEQSSRPGQREEGVVVDRGAVEGGGGEGGGGLGTVRGGQW